MNYEQIRLPIGIRREGGIFREVHIDEMSGVDEEILSNPKNKQAPVRAFTTMLQRCVQHIPGIVEEKQDPFSLAPLEVFRSMYQIDRDFILTQIRRISLGDSFVADWTCRYCDVANQDDVTISALPVKEWPDDKPTIFAFEIPGGMRIGDRTVSRGTMRLLTGVDTERVTSAVHRNPEQVSTILLTAMIESLEGGERPQADAIRRMRSADRNHLAEIIRDNSPGLSLVQDIVCASCGRLNTGVQLDATGFFSPTRRT